MFPPTFGTDPRIGPDLHKFLDERRPIRRSGPQTLGFAPKLAPFVSYDPPVIAYPRPRATLYDLANDPRFARRTVNLPQDGLRQRLGNFLLRLGWSLVRPRNI